MKPLKIGVLGCSNFAIKSMLPGISKNKNYALTAIASRSGEKAQSVAQTFNCKAVVGYENLLLEDIDAVYTPLPTALQHEWIAKSLTAGKHVFSEKSLSDNYQNVADLVAFSKKQNLCLMENFMFLHHSQYDFVRDSIAQGTIGEIRSFRSGFGIPKFADAQNIRYNKALGGGALNDLGAYTLMAARLILGPDHQVIGSKLNNLDEEVDFTGAILLESSKGICSQLDFGFDNQYQNKMEIWGEKGRIVVHRAFTAKPGFRPIITISQADQAVDHELDDDDQMQKMLDQFYESIMNNDLCVQHEQILSHHQLMETVRKNG